MRQQLDLLVTQHDLINRTFACFWETFDSYLQEEPQECAKIGFTSRASVKPVLYGYVFGTSTDLAFDFIKVYLDIFVNGESVRAGDYWRIYNLQGEAFDDAFIIF